MSPTWTSEEPPAPVVLSTKERLRALFRGLVLGTVVFGCLVILLLVRLVEKPAFGAARPWTPHITVFVCRMALRGLGLAYVMKGEPMRTSGAMVANHSSWLDIFALNAGGPLYFVSKSEVSNWPGIGWLARATGTVFVRRSRRDASAQKAVFEERLRAGHRLLFFPEGTSTDGQRVLEFKPTLFAALFSDLTPEDLWVQPVTVVYEAPEGEDPRFYGWWGDMEFGPHLFQVLARKAQGSVEVNWGVPTRISDMPDRKAMAKVSETAVRSNHPHGALIDD